MIKERTIGDIVASDYRLASVFKRFGIDFYCKGERSLNEACLSKNLDPAEVQQALDNASSIKESVSHDEVNSWSLDKLIDHIEEKHHRYVEKAITELKPFIDKIKKVHGAAHPELKEIKSQFMAAANELTSHMKKEELMLFPFIRRLNRTSNGGAIYQSPHFDSVKHPIDMMKEEHSTEGDRFTRISDLSDQYCPPDDACNTYKATYALLKEFEEDLHRHIHLENNILFPRAIELEKSTRN